MTALQPTYVVGDWVAVAAPDRWLLVALSPHHPSVQLCWSKMSEGASADDVLDLLASEGIRATPSFALVWLTEDEKRIVVRGSAAVSFHGGGSERSVVRSAPRAVWTDELIDGPVDEVCLDGGAAADTNLRLPMAVGVTMASAIHLGASGAGTLATPRTPEIVRALPPVIDESPEPVLQKDVVPAPQPEPEPESESEPESAPDDVRVEGPSYDFLFGETQRPADLAALARDSAEQEMPTHAEPIVPFEPVQVATADDSWHTLAPPVEVRPSDAGSSSLIDSFPWDATPATAADEARPSSAPTPSKLVTEIPNWTVPPPNPQPSPIASIPTIPPTSPASPRPASEQNGATTSRAGLLKSVQAEAQTSPTVLAGRCPAGHHSPPHSPLCRVCAAPMPSQQAFEIPRPPLGSLRLSTGDRVTLDRGVLLGRAPVAPSDAGEHPHLVRVAGGDNDVSRSHAEIVLDGWHVCVRDLGSTNGTTVTLPGQEAVRLRPGDLQLLEDGAVVTLADVVTCTFEVNA